MGSGPGLSRKSKLFLQLWPLGTPSGKGLYVTIYPLLRPNTDTVFRKDNMKGQWCNRKRTCGVSVLDGGYKRPVEGKVGLGRLCHWQYGMPVKQK